MSAFRFSNSKHVSSDVLLFVLFTIIFVSPSTAIAARADCNVVIANGRVLGSDSTKNTYVYGFDLSRADGKPLDAKLVAVGSDGVQRQEYFIHGALPARVATKNEWSGLAFSVPANAVTSILLVADPEPDAETTSACPTQSIDMKRVRTSQGGSWPISVTDPGMIDLPAAMVPAAGAVNALDITDAKCKVCKPPSYPLSATSEYRTGRVNVEVTIAADGTAGDFTVVDSSGYADLDNASLAAARASTFVAATVNGVPVDSRLVVPFTFNMLCRPLYAYFARGRYFRNASSTARSSVQAAPS